MMATLIVILIALAALAYVVVPLLRGPPSRPIAEAPYPSLEATRKKRAALGAIVDLEAERDMGKLTDADFDALRREYEAEALEALRLVDALGGREDDELEREIAGVRARLECPACGAPRQGSVCPRCGMGSSTETP